MHASLVTILLALPAARVHAIPALQLYLEGATYDPTTESWELSPPASDATKPFRLWAIGNVRGPGGKGAIRNVRLAVSYAATATTPFFVFTPGRTDGFGGFTDPSTPRDPTFLGLHTDGSSPILGDGRPLPSHGIFGPGTYWQEFGLGDFTRRDSPVADFVGGFPTEIFPGTGQINVYEVRVFGGATVRLHFDVYNGVEGGTHASFAPFSHDAGGTATPIPEPTSLCLFGLGGVAVALVARSRRKSRVDGKVDS
jgi:hypothetical protein